YICLSISLYESPVLSVSLSLSLPYMCLLLSLSPHSSPSPCPLLFSPYICSSQIKVRSRSVVQNPKMTVCVQPPLAVSQDQFGLDSLGKAGKRGKECVCEWVRGQLGVCVCVFWYVCVCVCVWVGVSVF